MENPSKALFDCQRMFRHACAFAEVADMAEAKFCHDTADTEWFSTPATVNSAFAYEVFLKSLLLFCGIPAGKKHKLMELYETLPEDVKEWTKQDTLFHYGGSWTDGLDLCAWKRFPMHLLIGGTATSMFRIKPAVYRSTSVF